MPSLFLPQEEQNRGIFVDVIPRAADRKMTWRETSEPSNTATLREFIALPGRPTARAFRVGPH
jgi:hypothetical protein